MLDWPLPTNLKQLRGSLGLTGYYWKFVKGYALVAQLLTELLKKNKFQWIDEAIRAFEELKDKMTKTLVLSLPDFRKAFMVENDASSVGIGAVLTHELFLQETIPNNDFSLCLCPRVICNHAGSPKVTTLLAREKVYN